MRNLHITLFLCTCLLLTAAVNRKYKRNKVYRSSFLNDRLPDKYVKTYNYQQHEFQSLLNKLWSLDRSRLTFNKDVRLSLQGRASWTPTGRDAARHRLFSYVNGNIFNKATIKAFLRLLDNYKRSTNQKEQITTQELQEEYNFLDAVLRTPVMQSAYSFLKNRGKASHVFSQFKSKLHELWFKPYWRNGRIRVIDSSGFEHVFVGEIEAAESKVLGFHNWIQFYMQEKAGQANYLGYLKKSQFKWGSDLKQIGSMFVGTSPEFEMALYTVVYLMRWSEIPATVSGMRIKVTCFGINRNRSIGTCYPDLL